VRTAGTKCKSVLADAGIAPVTSTIFVQVMLGTALERWGPVSCQSALMTFGAFWVAMAVVINAPWNYSLVRFFIGCAGAALVTFLFWCSLMFAPNNVGTADAGAAKAAAKKAAATKKAAAKKAAAKKAAAEKAAAEKAAAKKAAAKKAAAKKAAAKRAAAKRAATKKAAAKQAAAHKAAAKKAAATKAAAEKAAASKAAAKGGRVARQFASTRNSLLPRSARR
jgi:nitrate/nitrite transporter NarK